MILADSPQAHRRSARYFSTWQGRLPQELRLRGVRTLEAANDFLKKHYIAEFNLRFPIPSTRQATAFMSCRHRNLEMVLKQRFEHTEPALSEFGADLATDTDRSTRSADSISKSSGCSSHDSVQFLERRVHHFATFTPVSEGSGDGHLRGDGQIPLIAVVTVGLTGGDVDVQIAPGRAVPVDHDLSEVAYEHEVLCKVSANQVDERRPVRGLGWKWGSRHSLRPSWGVF